MLAEPVDHPAPPRWQSLWLAALAPLYVLSPLALLGLRGLRHLPRPALSLLVAYALSQQLPALFSPAPLEASLLALLRTALMAGLIGIGASWQQSGRLMPLGVGLLVVAATAVGSSLLAGVSLAGTRLHHPYMTPITLGLVGAVSVWLASFVRGPVAYRVALGLTGGGLLLLSASRGPLMAALLGLVAGLLVQSGRRVQFAGLAVGITAVGAVSLLAGQREGLLSRLVQADTTGRDLVWARTLGAYQESPASGVGSSLLGRYLQPLGGHCELWIGASGAPDCPAWLDRLGSPWLIAHNGALQALAETGPLGLLGLFLLVGTVVFTASRTRDALGVAVLVGLLIATLTDNTLLVPSPFFGEVFWLVAGVQLARVRTVQSGHLLSAAAALALVAFPVWVSAASSRPHDTRFAQALQFIRAPATVGAGQEYAVYSTWALPPGTYRLLLLACAERCATVQTQQIEAADGRVSVRAGGQLHTTPTQTLRLEVYPARSEADVTPLASYEWTVKVTP